MNGIVMGLPLSLDDQLVESSPALRNKLKELHVAHVEEYASRFDGDILVYVVNFDPEMARAVCVEIRNREDFPLECCLTKCSIGGEEKFVIVIGSPQEPPGLSEWFTQIAEESKAAAA